MLNSTEKLSLFDSFESRLSCQKIFLMSYYMGELGSCGHVCF